MIKKLTAYQVISRLPNAKRNKLLRLARKQEKEPYNTLKLFENLFENKHFINGFISIPMLWVVDNEFSNDFYYNLSGSERASQRTCYDDFLNSGHEL